MVLAKKPPLIVTIGTAFFLIAGGALAYWAIQWRLIKARGLPLGINAVPETAVAVVSLSTNAEQWQRLRQFGTPETQSTFDQQLADWRDRWLTRYDISFNRDIKPWVGSEITMAWLPSTENAQVVPEEGNLLDSYQHRVLLLPIADPEAAQLSAESLPLSTESEQQVKYRGVTLNAYAPTSGKDTSPLWMGVLGTQLVLVAEDEAGAQQAIDAYKGSKSLAALAGYRRSLEVIGSRQTFGKLYLNVPTAVQLLGQTSQPALPAALVDSFQDSRGLAAAVLIESQGVRIQSTSWLDSSSDRVYTENNIASQLPQYLPRDTLVVAAGSNFQQFWQDLSEQRNWGALTAFDPDNLTLALQDSTGLTLETDLLPWMSGEFALALIPPQNAAEDSENALPNPGLVTLMQVSDRTQAEKTFAQLDGVVKNRYRFAVLNEPVGKMELVKWISPFQSVSLSRGWIDSGTAFLTVGDSTEDAIVPKPCRSLASSSLFQLTTADAPTINSGYFYLNLDALGQTTDSLFLPTLPIENQGMLRAIQALGVTATVLDDQRLRYDLYAALKRGNRPGPLPSPSASAGEE